MGLSEILTLICLVLLCGIAVLLILLLKRPQGGSAPADNEALLDSIRRIQQESTQALRTEWQQESRDNRAELTSSVQTGMDRLGQALRASQRESFAAQDKRLEDLIKAQDERLVQLLQAQDRLFTMQDNRLSDMQKHISELMTQRMGELNAVVANRLSELDKQFAAMREQNRAEQEQLRRIMEEKMGAMQAQNAQQLEKMRETVDEKLQKTLNERISQSFKLVNERLAEVYRGLGEMQTLAANVGDLKKVMSGVKTRGILGEIQLGAIIEEMLSPEQYEANVSTKRNSANRVEYAVKLPGDGNGTVYLPIDAKFPADAYTHLLDAYDSADGDQVKAAATELERRIKAFAKDIHDKYIDPPYTTTFGIMFLPTEGLYAEAVRLGLVETLQKQYNISIAGPTTLSALLNSLQMGFRTLAIQKRSGEVWEVLGAVKTEFGNFQTVLEKAQERIEQTSKELDKLVGVRTRKINSKLRSVSELPSADAQALIGTGDEE